MSPRAFRITLNRWGRWPSFSSPVRSPPSLPRGHRRRPARLGLRCDWSWIRMRWPPRSRENFAATQRRRRRRTTSLPRRLEGSACIPRPPAPTCRVPRTHHGRRLPSLKRLSAAPCDPRCRGSPQLARSCSPQRSERATLMQTARGFTRSARLPEARTPGATTLRRRVRAPSSDRLCIRESLDQIRSRPEG